MDQLLQRPQISAMLKKAPQGSFYAIREANKRSGGKTGLMGTYSSKKEYTHA